VSDKDDWAEQAYLLQNPDVRQALETGWAQDKGFFTTAREHYQKYGNKEGRHWPGKGMLPEGHLAANKNTSLRALFVAAVDSETLARLGEVHGEYYGLQHYTSGRILTHKAGLANIPALDVVGFSLNGDARLDELRRVAQVIGKTYSDKTSAAFIADPVARERRICWELIDKVAETYGAFSDDTAMAGANSGERKARGLFYDDSAKLAHMEMNSLVCRQQAPVMSVLMQEAGIHNHLVNSQACLDRETVEYLKEKGIADVPETAIARHAYVITDHAIVEATLAGRPDAHTRVYNPIVNGVTVKDIVYRGQAAITNTGHLYGGHGGDGAWNAQNTLLAWQASIKRHEEAKAPAKERFRVALEDLIRPLFVDDDDNFKKFKFAAQRNAALASPDDLMQAAKYMESQAEVGRREGTSRAKDNLYQGLAYGYGFDKERIRRPPPESSAPIAHSLDKPVPANTEIERLALALEGARRTLFEDRAEDFATFQKTVLKNAQNASPEHVKQAIAYLETQTEVVARKIKGRSQGRNGAEHALAGVGGIDLKDLAARTRENQLAIKKAAGQSAAFLDAESMAKAVAVAESKYGGVPSSFDGASGEANRTAPSGPSRPRKGIMQV
jgi:hypothetical protein